MTTTTTPVMLVLDRLERDGGTARRNESGWSARCPAHDDQAPSLSISEGDDGRALLNCHAGCTTDAVLDALGLKPSDLFAAPATNGHRSIVATYAYVDEFGEVLFEVVRFAPKDFRQRRPDGRGGWLWKLGDTRRVPYRLPELLAAAAAGGEIFVVEGEKDADAARAAGVVGTTSPQGAGKWRAEFAEYFRGASWVLVVRDRDAPGHEHAAKVAASIRAVGVDVTILEPIVGKDLSDHFAAGHTLDDLVTVDESLMPPASSDVDDDDGELPESFWTARPELEHIRAAAWSRQRSAPAVLHVTLARIAAAVSHTLELPPIVGAPAALSYFTALLAPPGVGKSSASDIGSELLPIANPRVADQLPLGSGEGLAEVLFDLVDEPDEDGKKRRVKRQVRFGAYVYADEGQALADLGGRSGATLLPTLRTIWTGGTIGNTNASHERRRIVPAGQYVFGVVIGLQDSKAAALLDDAGAGTPQRFAWVRATDATIPDAPPVWPGPLGWTPPGPGELTDIEDRSRGYVRHQLHVAPEIGAELRAADLNRARGQTLVDELDAHGGLLQLKLAALLAILDHRLDVRLDDWELARTAKTASDTVRAGIVGIAHEEATRLEQQTADRLAARAVAADTAVERRRIVDTARAIATLVHDGRCTTVAEIRRSTTPARRQVLDDALAHAAAEQWIVETIEPGQGTDKRAVRAGDRRPS